MKNKRWMNMIWGVLFCLFFIAACGGGGGSNTIVVTPSAPVMTLSQSSYNFAGIVLNNYADRKFIVTNTGNANLIIGTISTPALPFSISAGSNTCSNTTLAPSQTCSFMARFTPTSEGLFADTISIPSNLPTRTISLSGDGYGLNVWINKVTVACPIVTVDVTVNNPNGLLVPDPLAKTNFTLWHNNVEVLTADFTFAITDPDPVSVVLALDLSASLSNPPYPANIKLAAVNFVERFLPRTTALDQAAIYKFKDNYIFDPAGGGFRLAKAANVTLVNYINNTGGEESSLIEGTALYDAVYASIDKAAAGLNGKKAVIVLSDGVDDPQHTEANTLASVIAYAKLKGIPVFTIFYVDLTYYPDATPAIMQQLAQDTGGQYFNSGSGTSGELAGIFQQIFNILSNKYTLTYTPSTCSGSQIPVEVQVTSSDPSPLHGLDTKTINLP